LSDRVSVYVSAASDLEEEREVLGRAVTEVPVSLGWRIVQSPLKDEPVDLEAVVQANVHLFLLGSDIRAPVGQEWLVAGRMARRPELFLKKGVLRTPAAQDFIRFVGEQAGWREFSSGNELRGKVLRLLVAHILAEADRYALSPVELTRLQACRSDLERLPSSPGEDMRGGAGESGVVLSRDRYVPSEGVLVTRRDASQDRAE
jgi:hypothetical protein